MKQNNLTPNFFCLKKLYLLSFFAITILTFSLSTQSAKAAPDILNQQDWITRDQQNKLEETKRTKEMETIRKERERKKKEEENKKQQLEVKGGTAACIPIKEIKMVDANSLSSSAKAKLAKPFIEKCFRADILSDIVAAVNDYYQNNGYVTTQVIVPKQNLQSGIFELQIIEGRIEKILFGKDHITDKMQKFTAFGNHRRSVLNLNDINQGMYQINRLQSNSAVMKIEPGTIYGDSKVVIDNNKKFPARFTVSKDNLGNDFTGVQRKNFSAGIDNLLFLNDNLNLNYSTNSKSYGDTKDIDSFAASLSIPFEYNTFSYDYAYSDFKGKLATNSQTKYTGYSQQSKFGFDRVLTNQTNLRLTINSSLSVKDTASYQDDRKQSTSERKLSILNAGFAVSSYLNDTTSVYVKPSYSKGLKILNATQDPENTTADSFKAQFEAFKLYATLSKKFIIPKINAPVIFVSEMDSQFAKQTVYGSEQFSVGGYYSVRGFRENYINGDSGYYFRNKVNVSVGSLVLPLFQKEGVNLPSFLGVSLANLNKFKLEPFYDFGYIRNKLDGTDGNLSGAGIKTIFEDKYFNASLTYSQGITRSKLITSTVKEDKMIYFEISANCC